MGYFFFFQNDIIVEEGFHFEEDGLHVFPAVPEIEPESRFIHGKNNRVI